MTAKIIDGRQIAADIREELKKEVSDLQKDGIVPGLGVILVGDDPASKSYVKAKEKACAEIGIYSDNVKLDADTSNEQLLEVVKHMNEANKINGILVQLPLPDQCDENEVIMAISPDKDVDGFHPISIGKMVAGQDTFLPCTPYGVVEMIKRSGIETQGANTVIIGRSNIVGKPLANLLLQKGEGRNSTVTVCHTGTKDIKKHTLEADIVIAAAGRPNTLTADMIKEGAAVIDVGVNRVEDSSKKSGYRLVGDVDFEAVKEKASFITPVPGGVGPMTITMLMYNTVLSAKKNAQREQKKLEENIF